MCKKEKTVCLTPLCKSNPNRRKIYAGDVLIMRVVMKWKLTELKKLRLQNFLMLLLAGCINAFGVTVFLAPVKLYDSGISGTSILLSQITPAWTSLSLFLLVLNLPLFLYGLRKQGLAFTVYSIFAVAIYSLGSWLITDILPIDVAMASPLAGQDLLLCALFGGVISGVGSGLTLRSGGAIDGIEVMAAIFAKRLGISVGTFVMIYNVFLYIICGLVMNSWILPLYSIVTYAAGLKTVDFIAEGIDRSKEVMIITERPEEISKALMTAFNCGITKIQAVGGFSNANKTIVFFVVNRFQVAKTRDIVRGIDSKAFVTISEVADMFKENG